MYEGQVVFKPLPFVNNRFKKQNKYLIEIKLDRDDKYVCLYYISNNIEVVGGNKLEFVDKKSGCKFSEMNEDTVINVYDAYSIEHVSTDYSVWKTDMKYTYISRYIIYANRNVIQAVKVGVRKKFEDNMSYSYQSVIKKKEEER